MDTLDYNALFEFWACTGLSVQDFTKGVGLEKDANFLSISKDWKLKLQEKVIATPNAPTEWVKTLRAKTKNQTQFGDISIEPFKRQIKSEIEVFEPEIDCEDPKEFLTQKIIRWRESQAVSDWRLAECIRDYVKEFVLNARQLVLGQQVCLLNASDIKSITGALVDLQKVQRLALGMSSENVGFPLSGVNQGGEQIPTVNFIVEGKKDES